MPTPTTQTSAQMDADAPANLTRGDVGHAIEQLYAAREDLRNGRPIHAQRILEGVRSRLTAAVDPHPIYDEYDDGDCPRFDPRVVWPDTATGSETPEPVVRRGWLRRLLPTGTPQKPRG